MKKILKRLLSFFGIKIIRLKNSPNRIPQPTVDLIEIITAISRKHNRQLTILQIGACDGKTSDSIYPYILSGTVNAFLVEPSAVNFRLLSEFYQAYSGVTLIRAAVDDQDGKRPLYTVKDFGRWKDSSWARQLASFHKSHLLKHGIREDEIQEEEVNCLSLSTILKTYHIGNLDVLLIDTEGYDAEIVKMSLLQNILPAFIVFENVHIWKNYNQQDIDELYGLLKLRNYKWVHDRINTMAVRSDLFLER